MKKKSSFAKESKEEVKFAKTVERGRESRATLKDFARDITSVEL